LTWLANVGQFWFVLKLRLTLMTFWLGPSRFAGWTAAILLASATAAFSDCGSLLQAFNQALERRALGEVTALEKQIAVDAACGNRLVEVRHRRATLQLLLAQQLIEKGAKLAEYEALIADADKPDVSWLAAKMLGDIRFRQRAFADAARAYDRAVEIIKNPSKTPMAPGEEQIRAVPDLANQSRLLAANEESSGAAFVAAPKDYRDGSVGGAFSENIRGFRPKNVPLPINFQTASARFTAVGQAAADELVTALREQNPQRITIVGHTDERGGHDYNMRLSSQRATAVADFLRQKGIVVPIVTVAKGKTAPLFIADSSGLTKEDVWALNRRVEWQRN
jgi:outer membrane protein OmpA-like peptidoglycan-associated protein